MTEDGHTQGLRKRIAARLRRLGPARCSRAVLAVGAAATAIYLVVAPKPWLLQWSGRSADLLEHYVPYYCWWGGLIALAGLLLLAVAAPWWTKPLPVAVLSGAEERRMEQARHTPRWFWPLVGAAMLITAVLGAQRLHFSFWDDEHYTARRFASGHFKQMDDGSVRFRERGWGYAFYDYRMPNNHILHSLLAQGSVRVWRVFRDRDGLPYSEAAMRVPAYLFGILSVAALAWLLKELGLARAGVLAAFLLAVHPWHMRYASEARGYSLVLFLLPLLLACWLQAMRTGWWRWWIAFGVAQFCLLYTYPAVLYPVAALNMATVVLLLARRPLDVAPFVPLSRWFVAGAAGALAFLWLFLPCVPQMREYLAGGLASGAMNAGWWNDFGAHLFAGVTWFRSGDVNAPQPELRAMMLARPWLSAAVLGSAALLAMAGLARWISRGWLSAVTALVFFLPAGLAWWLAVRSGTFLYTWYLIYMLPGAVAAVAIGFDTLGAWSRRPLVRGALPAVALAAFVAAYLVLVADAPRWLLTKSIQPLREAALAARGTIEPNYAGREKVITASLINPLYYYDPHRSSFDDMPGLLALAREADGSGKEFLVHIGIPGVANYNEPDIYRLLTDSGCFEKVASLPGYDPTLDRIVVRYRPGSLSSGLPSGFE